MTKPTVDPAIEEAISVNCDVLGINVSPSATEKLSEYATEICQWNRRVNLTGAKKPIDFIRGPLFDAMTLVPVVEPTASFIDVGSGGGLPGIPLLILHPLPQVTLIEPRAKRAAFLRHIVAHLQLDAAVEQKRLEALHGKLFNAAVAQAVFEPLEWIRRAKTLVPPDGMVYVLTSMPLPKSLPGNATVAAERRWRRAPSRPERYAYRLSMCPSTNKNTTARNEKLFLREH